MTDETTVQTKDNGCRTVNVERVVEGSTPAYPIHGEANCVHCGERCWLGDEAQQLVLAGEAQPLCMVCADFLRNGERVGNAKEGWRA